MESAETGAFDFALAGWAAAIFPRDLLLQSVGKLLAADVLEASKSADSIGRDALHGLIEDLSGRLDRSSVVKQLLTPEHDASHLVEEAASPQVRRSLYQRSEDALQGQLSPAPRTGVRVLMRLEPNIGSEYRNWPDELVAADAEAQPLFEARCQNIASRLDDSVIDVVRTIVAHTDTLIKEYPGGSELAREFLRHIVQRCRSEMASPKPQFIASATPSGLTADLPTLFEHFRQRCDRQPGWQAVVSRAAAAAGLVSPLAYFLALPIAIPLAAGLLTGTAYGGIFYWSYRRLAKIRDEIIDLLQEKFGRGLFQMAQDVAAHPQNGFYAQIIRFIEDWEEVVVRRFDDERDSSVRTALQLPEWPDGFNLKTDLLEIDDPQTLYNIIRKTVDKPQLETFLRRELQNGLFDDWRFPDFAKIIGKLSILCRETFLESYELAKRFPGYFREDLKKHKACSNEETYQDYIEWIVVRLNSLALRSLPKALEWHHHPGSDSGEQRKEGVVRFYVPRSWRWHKCYKDPSLFDKPEDGMDEPHLPASSYAETVRAQFDPGQVRDVLDSRESDVCAALVLLDGLNPEDVLKAMTMPSEGSQ